MSKGVWPKRPFKIVYQVDLKKIGRVVACSSPEAVVKSSALMIITGRAERAVVMFDNAVFAVMYEQHNGAVKFSVM